MGGTWDRRKIGPRSPTATVQYSTPFGLTDPAQGAKVLRCRVCGMPSTAEAKLLDGVWTRGTFTMRLVLCEREIPALDPRATDPLTAA